jgi:hypothetical protein
VVDSLVPFERIVAGRRVLLAAAPIVFAVSKEEGSRALGLTFKLIVASLLSFVFQNAEGQVWEGTVR